MSFLFMLSFSFFIFSFCCRFLDANSTFYGFCCAPARLAVYNFRVRIRERRYSVRKTRIVNSLDWHGDNPYTRMYLKPMRTPSPLYLIPRPPR